MVVEVMGRHAGWIALYSGIAGGGDVILIPEQPFDIERGLQLIGRRHSRGRVFSIVVVAEGALPKEGTIEVADGETDEFGHVRLGGIGHLLEREIEERTASRRAPRSSATSSAAARRPPIDRVLATRFGVAAIDAAHEGRWGTMPALHGTRIELVALAEAVAELRTVRPRTSRLPSRSWVSAGRRGADRLLRWRRLWGRIGGGRRAATLRVYVSLPLRGPTGADGRDAADGARLALADAGGEAGGVRSRRVPRRHRGLGAAGRWSPCRRPRTLVPRPRTRPRSPTSATSSRAPRAPRCRSPTRPGCSRSRPRAPRSTWSPPSPAPTRCPSRSRAESAASAG